MTMNSVNVLMRERAEFDFDQVSHPYKQHVAASLFFSLERKDWFKVNNGGFQLRKLRMHEISKKMDQRDDAYGCTFFFSLMQNLP